MRNTTYDTWRNMKMRCTDPNHIRYCDYGAKGITFDPRWGGVSKFFRGYGAASYRANHRA